VGSTVTAPLTIDFNDTTQLAQFDLCTSSRKYPVTIAAPVGELLRPHTLNEKEFIALQSESLFCLSCVSACVNDNMWMCCAMHDKMLCFVLSIRLKFLTTKPFLELLPVLEIAIAGVITG